MRAPKSLHRGELIFSEEPAALLQTLDSRAVFPACASCHAPLGTPSQQLAFAMRQYQRAAVGDDASRAALADPAARAAIEEAWTRARGELEQYREAAAAQGRKNEG